MSPLHPAPTGNPEADFDLAVRLTGEPYLAVERALRGGGPATVALLRRKQASEPDVFARFVAGTVADWMEQPIDELAAAMDMLHQLDLARRETPAGQPRADVVESRLTRQYGARLVPFLALRLVKEPWPPWQTMGSLLYLLRHHLPSAVPAVARYALTAPLPAARELSLQTLVATVGEPATSALLQETRASLGLPAASP